MTAPDPTGRHDAAMAGNARRIDLFAEMHKLVPWGEDVLILHRAMRDILTRHAPAVVVYLDVPWCDYCDREWPCPDAEAVLRCYETEEGE